MDKHQWPALSRAPNRNARPIARRHMKHPFTMHPHLRVCRLLSSPDKNPAQAGALPVRLGCQLDREWHHCPDHQRLSCYVAAVRTREPLQFELDGGQDSLAVRAAELA
jgi:hypothetical protein